jgi:hypothetical protein
VVWARFRSAFCHPLRIDESRLFLRLRHMAAGFLQLGLLMGAMLALAGRFFSRLWEVRSALGEIFAVFVLHLDDFFIVCYVSRIRHHVQ